MLIDQLADCVNTTNSVPQSKLYTCFKSVVRIDMGSPVLAKRLHFSSYNILQLAITKKEKNSAIIELVARRSCIFSYSLTFYNIMTKYVEYNFV